MKAAILNKHDKNTINLEIQEIAKPIIKDNQVLLKVVSAGVNPLDNLIVEGSVKMIVPYNLPLVMGNEVVGIVEEIGSQVKGITKGSRMFARLPLNSIGAFAEYVAIDSDALAVVPDYLSDEEAAAVPLTALTVMQAFELMNVQSGKTIFISGGTGAVGAMAIPLAKAKGLNVITNGSAMNKERVLAIGAQQFLDYKTEDYTILKNMDYVLDTIGGDDTLKQLTILKNGGHLISLKGMPNKKFAQRMNLAKWKTWLFSLVGSSLDKKAQALNVQYDFIFTQSNGQQLQEAINILAKNQIKPAIDQVYAFEDINQALIKVKNGQSKGKTIIKF